MLARVARPKLTLTVPTVTSPTVTSNAPKSPFPIAVSHSPITSPTARNTLYNQRGLSTLSPRPLPVTAQATGAPKKNARTMKKISFNKETRVNLVSPMPADYHGDYRKISKEEERWGSKAE